MHETEKARMEDERCSKYHFGDKSKRPIFPKYHQIDPTHMTII